MEKQLLKGIQEKKFMRATAKNPDEPVKNFTADPTEQVPFANQTFEAPFNHPNPKDFNDAKNSAAATDQEQDEDDTKKRDGSEDIAVDQFEKDSFANDKPMAFDEFTAKAPDECRKEENLRFDA